jgi:hypothetical protein
MCLSRGNPSYRGYGSDNINDAVRKHRHGTQTHPERIARGDRSSRSLNPNSYPDGYNASKLNADKVRWIFRKVKSGATHRGVAQLMGVSRGMITGIMNGHCWKHLGLLNKSDRPKVI